MKFTRRATLILILLSVFFASCKKDGGTPIDSISRVEAQTLLDVSYGAHAAQQMDVYLPANRNSSTPLVIFIHGGSFISGDKTDYTPLVKELVRANFAVLNVNYRLVDATGLYDTPSKHMESPIKIKDQVTDVAAVVDFAIGKAKEWQVSESKMAMAGHSAGATLSLLYSYDVRNTNKIKVVANLAASLDQTFSDIPSILLQFLPDYILEAGYRYTGFAVSQANDPHYRNISPLYMASSDKKIPTLNVFPELNSVNGLPKQDRATFDAFTTKLTSLGVPNKFVLVAGADHEFSKTGNIDVVLKETINYFNANLK